MDRGQCDHHRTGEEDYEPARLFDLEGRTIRFTPGEDGSAYDMELLPLNWDPEFGSRLGERDCEVQLNNVQFPFCGTNWRSLRVSPGIGIITFNGHTAFGYDRSRALRGFGDQMTGAAPIISPLYRELMPAPVADAGSYCKEMGDRVVVTWIVSDQFGPNTYQLYDEAEVSRFQVVLYANGTVDFSYAEMALEDGIVGLFPILATGQPVEATRLDISAGGRRCSGAVFEEFYYASLSAGPPQELMNAVGDQFDFMAFYTDFRTDTIESGLSYNHQGDNYVKGVGRDESWAPAAREKRLLGYQVDTYIGIPSNASDSAGSDAKFAYDHALYGLSHEWGHAWMAYADAVVDGRRVDLHDAVHHWRSPAYGEAMHAPSAFPLHQAREASPMGGEYLVSDNDGTYDIETVGGVYSSGPWTSGFSHLDLYLMGLIPQEEVPDFFFLEAGTRTDVTIDEVIAANGPRIPSCNESQRDFNFALIGIVLPGQAPSEMMLERLHGIREAFIDFWPLATGRKSAMRSDVLPMEALPSVGSACGVGVSPQVTASALILLMVGPGRSTFGRLRKGR